MTRHRPVAYHSQPCKVCISLKRRSSLLEKYRPQRRRLCLALEAPVCIVDTRQALAIQYSDSKAEQAANSRASFLSAFVWKRSVQYIGVSFRLHTEASLSDAIQHVAISEHKKMTDLLQLLQPLGLFSKEFSVGHQKVLPAEMTSVCHAIKWNSCQVSRGRPKCVSLQKKFLKQNFWMTYWVTWKQLINRSPPTSVFVLMHQAGTCNCSVCSQLHWDILPPKLMKNCTGELPWDLNKNGNFFVTYNQL